MDIQSKYTYRIFAGIIPVTFNLTKCTRRRVVCRYMKYIPFGWITILWFGSVICAVIRVTEFFCFLCVTVWVNIIALLYVCFHHICWKKHRKYSHMSCRYMNFPNFRCYIFGTVFFFFSGIAKNWYNNSNLMC